MKSLENTTVSLVSHVSNTKTHPGTVGEILKCIKNGKWRKRLEKLRACLLYTSSHFFRCVCAVPSNA